jgi:hypothetical protein
MTEEDEAFNEIERQAKQRKESVMAAVHTLTEHQRGYENGFVDGMQKQAQSSVDKAVNAMSQRTEQEPVGPTEKIYKAWEILVGQHKDLLEENKKLRNQLQRTWAGLTDGEIDQLAIDAGIITWIKRVYDDVDKKFYDLPLGEGMEGDGISLKQFASLISKKLKEKNT